MSRYRLLSAAALALLACAAAVSAQDTVTFQATAQPLKPGEKIMVYAGPGYTYYPVGEIAEGTVVQVVQVDFNWVMIKPPAGVYSYISQAFVYVRGDGRTGTVNKDNANVYAAHVRGPGESWRRHAALKKDTVVTIAGEEGSFYKIVPPPSGHVYLEPGAWRRIEGEPAPEPEPRVEPEPEPEPEPVPAVEPQPDPDPAITIDPEPVVLVPPTPDPVVTPEPTIDPAPTIVLDDDDDDAESGEPIVSVDPIIEPEPTTGADPTPVVTPAAISGSVAEAEARFAEAQTLALEDRPNAELLATYRTLAADTALAGVDRRIVAARVRQLERDSAIAEALREIHAIQQRIDEEPIISASQAEIDQPPRYDAVGQLVASTVYDGRTLPRLYRLVDPASMRTIGYVRPSADVDPSQSLGQVVGLVGQARYDAGLKLRVIDVQRIDVLGPKNP